MLKTLANYILSANVSSENYKLAEDDMYQNNVMMLRLLSSLAAVIFTACTILGFSVPNMQPKLMIYMTGMFLSVGVLLAAFFSRSRKLHTFCIFLFDIMLLAAGLLITLVSAPEQLTVTLIPVALLVPLLFDMRPIGFLTIVGLTDLIYVVGAFRVKPAEIRVLDLVDVLLFSISGIVIGTTVVKAKLEKYAYAKTIHRIALFDGLTKCYNRKSYADDTGRLTGTYPEDFVLISLDLNGLKAANDSLGHEAGDEIIIGASQCMLRCFGPYGKVYRTGGDEFSVILRTGGQELDRLLNAFEEEVASWHGTLVDSLSISWGYVTAEQAQGLPLHEAAALADKKMYAAKSAYYSSKGMDRRKQAAAYSALCLLYRKILKINLTNDSYTIVNMDPSEQTADLGFSDSLSGWLKGFGLSGQVHPDDLASYSARTDLEYLKNYFHSGKTSINIHYRRKFGDEFHRTAMEMVPADDYRRDNQSLFLYVKKADL